MGVCRRREQDLCIWEFVGKGNTVHMGVCRRREQDLYIWEFVGKGNRT